MSSTVEDVQSIQWDNNTTTTKELNKELESMFGSIAKAKDPSLNELKAKMKSKIKSKRDPTQKPVMPNDALNMLQQSMEEMSLAEAQGTQISEAKQKEIFSKTQGVLSNLMKSLPSQQRKMFEGDSGFAQTLQKMMAFEEEKPTSKEKENTKENTKEMPLRPRVERALVPGASLPGASPTTPLISKEIASQTPSKTTEAASKTLNKSQKRNKRRRLQNKILLSSLKNK